MKIISVDPGASGAFCIKNGEDATVYDMPSMIGRNGKKQIDIAAIVKLLEPHKDADIFVIEDVHCMVGNGAVSMFTFGRGKGILEGVAFSMGMRVIYVSPQAWKKFYAELAPPPKPPKPPKGTPKKPKEAKPKTTNEKKEAAKQKRLVKAHAKEKARTLAGEMYPQLKDRFKTVNSDGRAEAVLIAHFAEKNYTEIK